jgi:plasmid maintenance system antidote protein VapI
MAKKKRKSTKPQLLGNKVILRDAIKASGKKQNQIAKESGIKEFRLSNLKNCVGAVISDEEALSLKKVLGLSSAELEKFKKGVGISKKRQKTAKKSKTRRRSRSKNPLPVAKETLHNMLVGNKITAKALREYGEKGKIWFREGVSDQRALSILIELSK